MKIIGMRSLPIKNKDQLLIIKDVPNKESLLDEEWYGYPKCCIKNFLITNKLFQRVKNGETVKALISTPPQHGKSVTCLHALVWLLKQLPTKRHAYATYAQQFSRRNRRM